MAEKQQPSALTGSAGLWSAVVLLAVAGIVGVLYVQNDADLHRVYDSDMGCLFDLQRSHTINFQCCFIRVGPAVACHTFCGRLFVWTYFLAGLLRPLTSSIMEFNLPDGKYGQCLRKEVRQDCTDASGRVPGGRPRVYTDCPQVEM